MYRRLLSLSLAAVLSVCFLSACARRKTDNVYYGDNPSKNTLVICIDVENNSAKYDPYSLEEAYEKFVEEIKIGLNLESVTLEVLPGAGVERDAALQRMRVEIMSGSGPDVFILNTVGRNSYGEYESALVNFPEKSMEIGLFLPLDDYMENNTQFTDWNMQTQAILNSGRSSEGQILIPLTYTLPVIVYPEHAANIPYTTELTMQEILNNPDTAELGAAMYTSLSKTNEVGRAVPTQRLANILGTLADYDEEELLFTEDELYETLIAMRSLHDAVEANPYQYVTDNIDKHLFQKIVTSYFDTDMAMLPIYSMEGGVTASVLSFAAISRNTNIPEEAFSVLDYMMQEKMQLESELYSFLLGNGLTLQNDIGGEEKPLYSNNFLDKALYEDFIEIKEQITDVNYVNELDVILSSLVMDSVNSEDMLQEVISESYETMKRRVGE